MIIARFEFHPEHAGDFCADGHLVSELAFEDLVEMVTFTKEIEHCLTEVLVFDGEQVISLKEISRNNPKV